MTTRTLYGYWRSSASYRVRIALAIKGIAYEQVPINLAKGAQSGIGFKLLNPQGMVPYLIDGDAGINQSLAIVEYLDEVYPEPPLLPQDPLGRARVRGIAQQIACDIHPVNNLRVLNYLRGPLAQPQDAVDTWYRHWIEVGFEALEEIAEAATGTYLFGDTVTLADICLVPQMWNARRLQADIARFPKLSAIDVRLNALPAVAASRPERQPDATK
nr:maleylacetoacetate isomerase [Polymorphobacter sp.]